MILFLFVSLIVVNTVIRTKPDLLEFPVISLMLFSFPTIEWLFQSSFHPSSQDLACLSLLVPARSVCQQGLAPTMNNYNQGPQ